MRIITKLTDEARGCWWFCKQLFVLYKSAQSNII